MKKRVLSILLTAVMLLGIIPTGAFALEDNALPEETLPSETFIEDSEAPAEEESLYEPPEEPENESESDTEEDADEEFSDSLSEVQNIVEEEPDSDEVSTVTVTIRSQMSDGYMHAIGGVTVSSYEAESFGYTDSVDGVSALDALVKAHELTFGEAFTAEDAQSYLDVSEYGYVTTVFGTETSANGFFVNGAYPNDGTESSWGGYNGTTVTIQQIYSGDVLDFFVYGDTSTWSDSYTFISVPDKIYAGRDFAVTVSGTAAMNGYLYADSAAFKAAATPVEGAGFAWVDVYGGITVISDVCSNENGSAVLTAPEAGTYLLTAISGDGVYCLMNPIAVTVESNELLKSSVVIRTSNSVSDLSNAILAGENEQGIAVFDSSVYEYSLGDILTDANTQLRFCFDLADDNLKATLSWKDADGKEISRDITKAPSVYCLHPGQNTLTLTIGASGIDSDTYTIRVGCKPTLTALNVTEGDTLLYTDVSFAPDVFDYTLTVPESADKVHFDAQPANEDYTLLINGGESADISPVDSDIKITLQCQDGTQSIYTLAVKRVVQLDLVIVPSPADAIVRVYDQKGVEIPRNDDGSYSGMFGEYDYTYTVTKYGYIAENGTVPANGGKLDVVLQTAPETDIEDVGAEWGSFRGNDDNMGITETELPTNEDDAELIWAKKLGTGWADAPSVQIIADNSLIVMSGKKLYKIDLAAGEIISEADMVSSPSYGYTPPTYAEGMIFCPLDGGIVQAFNAKTLESLWVYTDVLGGQALSPITYSDGYIYTGFWNSEKDNASYVCLSVTDEDPANSLEEKQASWRFVNAGGYYWAGSLKIGNAVIFGSDDGAKGAGGNAHLYSVDRISGALISDIELFGAGDIHSTIVYDSDSGRIFFTTAGGYLCSAFADTATGAVSDVKMTPFNAKSSSSPVVYKGRVYFGTGALATGGSSGNFVAADAVTLEMISSVALRGYPQCSALLSTAYESDGYLYFYCTYNSNPGGISLIKVNAESAAMELSELYNAEGFEQYCIASLICDKNGTIYYKNDSGSIMAVGFSGPAKTRRLIDAIGEVTLDSGEAISAANEAYYKLTDIEKEKVTNYSVLEAANKAYEKLMGNIAATELAIDSIGSVTADSREAIEDAQKKYDELSDDEKRKVSNYSKLTKAESEYAKIMAAIADVEEKISATDTADKNSKKKIAVARKAYDALPSESKKYVSNYYVLEVAEATLESANNVTSLISEIGNVTTGSGTKITKARKAYDLLSDEEKALVSNYETLLKAEAKYDGLKSTKTTTATTKTTTSASTSSTKTTESKTITVEVNGKKYTVDERAAELMTKIGELAEKGNAQESDILSLYRSYAALPETIRTQVYNYGDLEKMMAKLGEKNHCDSASGVAAEGLDWNIKLKVEEVTGGTEYGYVLGSINGNRLIKLVRVSFVDILTDKTFESADAVKLSIPAEKQDGETDFALYCVDNMMLNETDFDESDGVLKFNAQSGLYALVGVMPDEETEKTPNADSVTLPLTWAAAGSAGIAVLLAVLVIKLLKRKE